MNKKEREVYRESWLKTAATKDKPITARELSLRWGTTPRGVRLIINELRVSGTPICSDNKGYWIPANVDEMAETVRRIRAHALQELTAMSKMAKACRAAGYKV
jgi:hypothetical protein